MYNTVCIEHCERWAKKDVHTPGATRPKCMQRHTTFRPQLVMNSLWFLLSMWPMSWHGAVGGVR